eukprot:COSAG02_NODE_306_length_25175_cov_76.540118_12_plen_177_part_00
MPLGRRLCITGTDFIDSSLISRCCDRLVLTKFDSGRDELALQHKRRFVERTLPCVDPTAVDLFMRCLYCNVQPNESTGADFIVGLWRRDTRRVFGKRALRTTGRVVAAVGFSGEGFKCAMVVGELACQEAIRPGTVASDNGNIVPESVPTVGGESAVDATALLEEMRERFDPRRFL